VSAEVGWLLLSFAIGVVAMLANPHEKLDSLQERLDRLETPERDADEGIALGGPAPVTYRAGECRDHRAGR
jgi:hypothetical protein